MKAIAKAHEIPAQKSKRRNLHLVGPSLYEMEYLRQLKEELEIFLRSKNFHTIHAVEIAFTGGDYIGRMRIQS